MRHTASTITPIRPGVAFLHAGLDPLPDVTERRAHQRPVTPLLAGGVRVGIHYIARELALPETHTARTLCDIIRGLVEGHGFPPCNPRRWQGRVLTGGDAVAPGSVWIRADVDQWLQNRHPSGPGVAARARQVDSLVHDRLAGAA